MFFRLVTLFAPPVLLLAFGAACGGDEQAGTQDTGADSTQFDVMLPDTSQPVDLFDPNDTSPDAPDTGPCVGCTGYPCATNAECNSGFCIEAANGRECADFCRDECPVGYGCRGVQGPGGDPVYLCIYDHVTYCQPCKADRDCETGLGGLLGARCVAADAEDPVAGSFCRTPCDTSAACPVGASCEAVSIGGVDTKLCRPGSAAAPGECACSRRAVALGSATSCEVGNALGTCPGERRCEREGVDGLSACDARTPVGELCNDVDDDCDGETDEGFSELGQTCDGDDSDQCKDGVFVCGATGALGCTDDLASQIERCNGLDDDCDGETDEDFVGLGESCDGVDADLCKDGVWVCDGLAMVCDDDTDSKSETCNGLDDDCDGVVDDGYDVGTPCDGPADPDTCPDGAKVCNAEGTGTVCEDGPGGPVELCNGVDDDCDGAVDEGFEAKNTPCDGEDLDGCADGVLVCSGDGTRLVCNDDASSRVELCNELDDDCRAGPDDTFPLKLSACDGPDADQCPDGVFVCSADGLGLDCTDDGVSRIEVCNDLDDDCDGATDEDFTLKGQACDSPVDTDLCATGRWVCGGNTLVCNDDNASTTELCNGADDDCDGQADEVADLTAPLNPNQNGLCAGSRQRCAGGFGWAADYGGVAGFGQNETPDASFLDENCDGLDGTEALAVFVRQGAANSGTCTKANPCGSLTYAITQTTGTRRHVYVQAGTYDNIVEVPSGKDIEIYGGFDSNWQRRPRTEAAHTVTLRGAKHPSDDEYLTVRVRSATVKLADLVIVGPSPSPTERKDGRGYSTYAVHAVASTVTLERVDVQQGNAASGATGGAGTNAPSLTAPEKAPKGGNATQALDTCDNSSRGAGAAGRSNAQCSTGTAGATGGNGGTMDTSCGCAFGICVCTTCAATAGSGGGTGSGASGGGGGSAGSGGNSCSGVGNGNPGGTPTQGAGGATGTRGGFLVGNYWFGGNGGDGSTGSHGSGGGGGGGSGGCDRDGGIPLQNSSGAGGGGGGAGGCAAQSGGTHGKAGGTSFGVFASGGTVTARDCRFFLGNGGAGGTGGAGGQGQPGGLGGDGGNAAGTSQAGGSGGRGGDGAGSGGGGGGAGGSSYGIFSLSATVTTPNSTFTGGAAGAGGQGGTAQASTGANGPGRVGQDGRVQNTRTCNAANACGD